MIPILITVIIVAAVAGCIFHLSSGALESAAQMAHIVEGLAVVGALSFAGFEYLLHHDTDSSRKREASTAFLTRSFSPQYVDEALGKLYRKYDPAHRASTEEDTFDDDTGSLISYFWAIDACIRNDLCSPEVALDTYCSDYKSYIQAYDRIHGEEKKEAQFGGLKSLNKCFTRKS